MGVSRFSAELFLSHSAESFHFVGEPFSFSKVPCIEKTYGSDGDVTFFCRDIVCLTVPKIFLSESFGTVFQKFSGCEKVCG